MWDVVGQTMKVDATTMEASRERYPQVCSEINLNAPLVLAIVVLGSTQRVEYEGLHLVYFGCGQYGYQ